MTVASPGKLIELTAGIHAIPAGFDGVPLTLYVVGDNGGELALVDAGVATTPTEHVVPALAELGARPQDLAVLLSTHAHHDHVGGNASLRALHPALSIAMHRADVAWAESPARYLDELYGRLFPQAGPAPAGFRERILRLMPAGAAVDRPLEDGDVVRVGAHELEVAWTPAHSPGHVVLHDRSRGASFVGDALQGRGFEIAGRRRLFPCYLSLQVYRTSIAAIVAAGATYVCTAHFGALDRDGCARLAAESLAFADDLDALLVSALAQHEQLSLVESVALALAAWPQFEPGVQSFVTVNAHLVELARRRRAQPHLLSDGRKVWTRAVTTPNPK